MTKVLVKHLARLYLPVYQYESDTTKIIYAGYSSIKKNYYVRRILNSNYHQSFLGRRWFWQIPDLIKSRNLDMAISEISRISLTHFQKSGGYILPEWIEMRINIDRPMNEICRESVSDFSRVARRIRKYNLTYEIRTDDESFNYFKNKIYLPFITSRHGDEALVEDLSLLWRSSTPHLLMNIMENGVIVGGALIKKAGDSLNGVRLGLLNGNDEYLRHGVIGAIYYFSIIEGQKMGCRYLGVGGTRPFLNDGLTKYKLRLSAEFLSDYSPWKEYLWLGVKDGSFAVKEFIDNNQFLHLNKNHKFVSTIT